MTEQEKYGIEQLSEYLEMQIRIKDGRIKRYKEQMDSDFLYYFAWAGKDLFKEHYMVGKYKELRQILKEAESPEAVQDYLQRERGKCLEKLVDGEIYTHYSEDIFNLAHSYKTECRQQFIRDYNGFGQLLSMKSPRKEVKARTGPETMKKKSNGLKM